MCNHECMHALLILMHTSKLSHFFFSSSLSSFLPFSPRDTLMSSCLLLRFGRGKEKKKHPDTLFHSASEACRQPLSASPRLHMDLHPLVINTHTHNHNHTARAHMRMSALLPDHTDLIRDSLNSLAQCDFASRH